MLPADVQILNEHLCDHMPHIVGHPSHVPQLPHGGIHQGKTCDSLLPLLQLNICAIPRLLLVLQTQGGVRQRGKFPKEPIRQVSPHEAPQEGGIGLWPLLLVSSVRSSPVRSRRFGALRRSA